MFVVREWVVFCLAYALTLLCGVGGWTVQGFEHFETLMQRLCATYFAHYFLKYSKKTNCSQTLLYWKLFGISLLVFLSLTMLNVSWLCNVQDLTTFMESTIMCAATSQIFFQSILSFLWQKELGNFWNFFFCFSNKSLTTFASFSKKTREISNIIKILKTNPGC
jgi:hypothetical protein